MTKRSSFGSVVTMIICLLFASPGDSTAEDNRQTGVFYAVRGLAYETESQHGLTGEKGEFFYRQGEVVTFSVGGAALGSCLGKEVLTPADLIPEVGGFAGDIKNRKVTNIARFLQSLDADGEVENGIAISDDTRKLLEGYKGQIVFDRSEEDFAIDTKALFTQLEARLRTAAEARNHLRRSILGMEKATDVKIPTRDGAYLLADVFRPTGAGQYPVIMNLGVYGKAFIRGCICNVEDLIKREVAEDLFFEGNPKHFHYENHESAYTSAWVPKGYAVIRIDSRGVCNTPGVLDTNSVQEAEDYYDAIEWAARQPWSNGRVGLWGAGYYAMNQLGVASSQPPSLKAIVSVATDFDLYRQAIFPGGIENVEFTSAWTGHTIESLMCGEDVEWVGVDHLTESGFYIPEEYGYKGKRFANADFSKLALPMIVAMPQSHGGHILVLGSSETFIQAASEHKKLEVITGNFYRGYAYEYDTVGRHMAFFDHWLKGVDNNVMDEPPVRMMLRTGNREYTWRFEEEWPIARTEYSRLFLDASPSDWEGDGKRSDFMKLSASIPKQETVSEYSAEVDLEKEGCWSHGASFVTEPLSENMEIAGYIKLGLWVSSTSKDMDIFASVRVMDEDHKEVPYTLSPMTAVFAGSPTAGEYPVGLGWLKVSHREVDRGRSSDYQPYHTHLESDYAPLTSEAEVVEVEVGLWPTTALIRAGHRIRLDIQPTNGCGHGNKLAYDESYHEGARNSIYTGPKHLSYLQLPVIPRKK